MHTENGGLAMAKTRTISQWMRPVLRWAVLALLLTTLAGVAAGCGSGQAPKGSAAQTATTFPEGFPEEPSWYPGTVKPMKEAYLIAAHHQDALQHIPCYCGCGEFHTDNFACYFKRDAEDAVTAFDQHASGCQICVDVTRDVLAGLEKGKSVTQIRQEIDKKYQARGLQPTPTPMPPSDL